MLGIGVVEVLVMGTICWVGVAVVIGALVVSMRRLEGLDEQIARARRRQGIATALSGAAALGTLPFGLAFSLPYGSDVVLPILPSMMAGAACAVLWVGELTFSRQAGAVRTTVLNARTLADGVPRSWVRVCAGLAALDVAVLVAALDQGRSYPLLQGAALPVAALLAWLVCRSATTRPTISTDLHADAVLRRTTGGRVLRWLAFGLAATAAADLFVAAADWPPAAIIGWVLVPVAIVLPFAPVPQLPHTYPPPRTDTASFEVR